MTIQAVKFNKTNLVSLIKGSQAITVKDVEVTGLKFKIGKKRAVFQFEKRISQKSGKKSSPVTFTIGAFPAVSIEDARQEARRLATLCEKGMDPRMQKGSEISQQVALADVIEKFFELKAELSKRTLEKYQQVIQFQFASKWLEMDINAITADMVVKQFHQARQTAKDRCWEMLKVFTNIWNTCAPCFLDEDGESILRKNPVLRARQLLKSVNRTPPKRSVVFENQLGTFVATIEGLRNGTIPMGTERFRPNVSPGVARTCDMILLSLFTGFRSTETRCLKWEYVDLEHGIIRLPGKEKDKRDPFAGTKNQLDHWVPCSTYVWDLLRKLSLERSPGSPYLFPSIHNSSKPICYLQEVFKRIKALVGSHFSPHTCRRTFATIADEAGLGFLTVKRMLNHAYQGGVTGGYIVPGFNPAKERDNFQKVCDYILDRKAEYLGQKNREECPANMTDAVTKLRRYAAELGIDPAVVFSRAR